jgi:hypothetical protein
MSGQNIFAILVTLIIFPLISQIFLFSPKTRFCITGRNIHWKNVVAPTNIMTARLNGNKNAAA